MTSTLPVTAYLGLGSNMDDPAAQLEAAVKAVDALPLTRLLRKPPVYATSPWGKVDQPDFLNMVIEVSTQLSVEELLAHCKSIEAAQGRIKGERWGPRPVDIDILLFGCTIINTDRLTTPHKHMWERAFVLRPLADLRPDLRSPGGKLITELLSEPDSVSQEIRPHGAARKPVS